jgi:ketosteroid isomerase-like protein
MNVLKKTLLLALGALVLATGAANAKDKSAAGEEARLKAHEPIWFDLYNKGDAAGVANLYAQDAILMPPGAPAVTGRAAIQTFLVTDMATTKKAGVTLKLGAFTGAGVAGDSGWISGTWSATDASGATVDTGKYLEVSQRTGKVWAVTRDIWNSDKAPAPPAPPPAAKPPAAPVKK